MEIVPNVKSIKKGREYMEKKFLKFLKLLPWIIIFLIIVYVDLTIEQGPGSGL